MKEKELSFFDAHAEKYRLYHLETNNSANTCTVFNPIMLELVYKSAGDDV